VRFEEANEVFGEVRLPGPNMSALRKQVRCVVRSAYLDQMCARRVSK
jgi:hypothetical protein